MAIHAHPDDEAIGTGGVLARYSAEGVRTVLVTCTRGEVGEIAVGTDATPETLAEHREAELRAACDLLGVRDLCFLGYRDSGMAGTPDNDHPASFHRADPDEATGRLVALIRRFRPQVLVTYDQDGFYGHPDHIQAHRITCAAFAAAGDPARYAEQDLAPWTPLKLYYTAVPRSLIQEFARRLRDAGIAPPAPIQTAEAPFGTPDELVTTVVDVRAYVGVKRQALLCHRTQMGENVFFARMPEQLFHLVFSQEWFQRAASRVHAPDREGDIFAGVMQIAR
ncbi:MAG: N-acetyl-1-D-myo-inositol-2-amino-2-deoxy-alpha-D-glucopyranoside deacetylase [Chloroflexi bacterium]|nr:N-acetyl-1-D-myo-inositol-2-amino-2-deoxy-alpha-D-glucopyranoside deacetylase [Chloroflexota bacterium]